MGLTMERCRVCRGAKTLAYYEEYVDGEWVKSRRADRSREWLECKMETQPGTVRLADGPCEVCDGAGEYAVEHVACKIY